MTMRSTKKPRLADADTKEKEIRCDAFGSTADILRCLHCRQTTEFSLRLLGMLQQLADVDPLTLLVDSNFAQAHLRDELIRKRKNALQLHKIPGDCANTIIEFLHVPEACVLQRACRGSLAMVKRSLECPRPRAVSYRGKPVDGHIFNWLVRVYRACPKFKLAESCRYWASTADLWLKALDALENQFGFGAKGPRIPSKAVHALLDSTDVDPNCIRQEGLRTVLWSATYINDVELVRRLLTYPKLDVNSRYEGKLTPGLEYCDSTPFIVAGFFDHEEITRLLLADPRCDLNLRAKERRLIYAPQETTVVHISVSRRSFRVLEVLLASPRVDPNVRDANGLTALLCAIYSRHAGAHEAVQKLLACSRVDANERDPETGNTPLHLLCGFCSDDGGQEFYDLLFCRKDIDKNAKNNRGESILMTASFRGDVYMMRSLLADEEVDVDCVDNDGNTALHHALHESADFDNLAMCIDALRDSGRFDGKVNFRNKHSETALHVLLKHKHLSRESLESLLQFPDIDVNTPIDFGGRGDYFDSPLKLAVRRGYPDYVELLLRMPGIDLRRKDSEKRTPFELAYLRACSCSNEERVRVFELLLNAPAPDCDLSARNWKMLGYVASKALGTGNTSFLKKVLGTPRPGMHTGAKSSRERGSKSKRETALEYAMRMYPSCPRHICQEVVSIFKEAERKGI